MPVIPNFEVVFLAPPIGKKWKSVLGWALYDWGNSAFSTTIMAGFFPVFYGEFWRPETIVSAERSTFELGFGNSVASLLVAFMAPVIGTIADKGSRKKRFLATFAFLGVLMSAALFVVPGGAWLPALLVYGLAVVGFAGANIFYDSLLVTVAPPGREDFVSGFGYSLGYLGGGLLFAVNVLMVQRPELFGIADSGTAVRLSFLSVAVWWGVFTIPVLMTVEEPRGERSVGLGEAVVAGWRQLAITFREIRALRAVWMFLLAYWLYIDGVNTVIRMAVKFGHDLGFETGTLIGALLLTQFVGFPAALLYGWLGEKIGTQRAILIGIAVYGATTIASVFMSAPIHFYALAVTIGLVQGGVQALSRSYFGRLIPVEKAGEFFGFYNMLGKFAAILGPTLMGIGGLMLGRRYSIVMLLVLFVVGGWLLTRVREPKAA
ncbi:MAG: transporter, family [Candidatus Sumerlaeota bacterium]|nr:transporter, family [Candidatus Sumerlaeota bacterium]